MNDVKKLWFYPAANSNPLMKAVMRHHPTAAIGQVVEIRGKPVGLADLIEYILRRKDGKRMNCRRTDIERVTDAQRTEFQINNPYYIW